MARIGNLGKKIVFQTSDKKVLTFNNFTQKISGRWNTHDIIGKKPRSEFGGADLRKITFKVILDAMHGVRPRKIMEAMEKMVEQGKIETLVIGGKKVGKNRWKMTDISEAWDVIYNSGEVARATVNITLEEYV